nr:DUF6880 family protein [Oleiphilus messinensis]
MRICPEQQDRWQRKALALMTRLNAIDQIELLLALQQYEQAIDVAIDQFEDLKGCYYNHLLRVLEQSPETCGLLKVVIYRCLLLDVLDRAYTKAYTYGARYLKALSVLDAEINDYQKLDTHSEFEVYLNERHGRKRSFWALL